jgi:hypothetical protein
MHIVGDVTPTGRCGVFLYTMSLGVICRRSIGRWPPLFGAARAPGARSDDAVCWTLSPPSGHHHWIMLDLLGSPISQVAAGSRVQYDNLVQTQQCCSAGELQLCSM